MADKKHCKQVFSRSTAMILCIFLFSEGCTFKERRKDLSADQMSGLQKQIGWLHGNCLAIKNPDLSAGTLLTIVELGEKQKVSRSKNIGRSTNSDICHALLNDRLAFNIEQKNSFYQISSSYPIDLAIGLVDLRKKEHVSTPSILDVDENGVNDTFVYCSTSEGIKFSIWQGTPYKSKSLWEGYYYLGYDTEATCPEE